MGSLILYFSSILSVCGMMGQDLPCCDIIQSWSARERGIVYLKNGTFYNRDMFISLNGKRAFYYAGEKWIRGKVTAMPDGSFKVLNPRGVFDQTDYWTMMQYSAEFRRCPTRVLEWREQTRSRFIEENPNNYVGSYAVANCIPSYQPQGEL